MKEKATFEVNNCAGILCHNKCLDNFGCGIIYCKLMSQDTKLPLPYFPVVIVTVNRNSRLWLALYIFYSQKS